MNKTSLTFTGILFALLVPAVVTAAPPNTAGQTSPAVVTPGGVIPAIPTCDVALDNMLNEFKKPNMRQEVNSISALLVGDYGAAAEGAKNTSGGGFGPGVGGKAKPTGTTITGNGMLGALPTNEVYPLTFEISKGLAGKAMLKWTYRGKTYQGQVDNCTSGYWTANSASGAFMVKLGKPEVIVVPQ